MQASRILVIRRDNIGDLVCTLPLIRRLREQHPDAWIGALVTRYNAEVLHDNPDLDAVFTYTKAKHLAHGESKLAALWQRLRVLWRLRHADLDLVLLPASGTQASARRMAKLVGAKRIVAQDDVPANPAALHEVERTANLLNAISIPTNELPAAEIHPRKEVQDSIRRQLEGSTTEAQGPLIGMHISSRKPSQRWPATRFIEVMRNLHAASPQTRFALFWSPGDEANPLHPGDDRKAGEILEACRDLPLHACPTRELTDLIAGLSVCDQILCSDGGHMHLAAALGKPIVCLFGKSDAARWHPWHVPYVLLQTEDMDANNITTEEVLAALSTLEQRSL
ncbi:glycosyltransferase family 9 protein [Uliginosibacterium sp. H3]|uniref:Glycosyltransferase family 9 protein n=1 Tax=Uliginosibacterium silvisoli TaxID=3114758 RepID=A0ABU6K0P9_9RHOO|nr:glycosyltransferase family 9 protein [Uliginosibacterium sp. H3]